MVKLVDKETLLRERNEKKKMEDEKKNKKEEAAKKKQEQEVSRTIEMDRGGLISGGSTSMGESFIYGRTTVFRVLH